MASDPEGDHRADVAEDGAAHVGLQLVEKLVGGGERELVLAALGEDGNKGARGKRVKFIEVEVKGLALVLGNARPAHGAQINPGEEKGPEKARRGFPEASFVEVGNKDAAVVHNKGKVEGWVHLPDDVLQRAWERELPHFVLDG